jgi:hypothetical protein
LERFHTDAGLQGEVAELIASIERGLAHANDGRDRNAGDQAARERLAAAPAWAKPRSMSADWRFISAAAFRVARIDLSSSRSSVALWA